MSSYTIFNTTTGAIVITGSAPTHTWPDMLDLYPGTDILPGQSDAREEYVVNRVITPRPEGAAVADKQRIEADGLDEITITGLAPTTLISIDDTVADFPVADGEFTFTTDEPGGYLIRCEQFPTKYQEFDVVATG